MTPPKVFGVEMRQCEKRPFAIESWELEGVQLDLEHGLQTSWSFYWQVAVVVRLAGATTKCFYLMDTNQLEKATIEVCGEIERAITRIRAAADRLGK